jgi:general secretion pathway protein M
MKAWFLSLQQRERWILLGGVAAALLIVLWAFVLTPLRNESGELREAVTQKQRLLIDLGRVEAMQLGGSSSPAVAAELSLVVLVDRTAQSYGLALRSTRPDGADGISVTVEAASFDALLDWLITLETTHGATVESASFSGTREQGLVNGQLFLRRS